MILEYKYTVYLSVCILFSYRFHLTDAEFLLSRVLTAIPQESPGCARGRPLQTPALCSESLWLLSLENLGFSRPERLQRLAALRSMHLEASPSEWNLHLAKKTPEASAFYKSCVCTLTQHDTCLHNS